MPLLFDSLYLAAGLAGSPLWLYKLARSRKMRSVIRGKFAAPPVRASNAPAVWAHCASVGEVLLARGLIAEFQAELPDWEPLISYNTPTAVDAAAKHFPDATRFYCPADFSGSVTRAFDKLRPSMLILMELELWPNLILIARKRGIPVAVVNGRITKRAARGYSRVKRLMKPVLDAVSLFAMQSEGCAGRIIEIGADPAKVHNTGSMKHDNVSADEHPDAELGRLLGIKPDAPVIVGGCTYAGEDEALIEAYKLLSSRHPGLRLILAPRHPERHQAVENAISAAGYDCLKRSQLASGSTQAAGDPIIMIDTVGELERVYSLATVAFVGGSLIPRGGHNIMEPAGRGKPVLAGPHTANFADAVADLERAGGLETIRDEQELLQALDTILDHPKKAEEMGRRAREVILRHKGATRRTIELLKPLTSHCS